MFGETKAMNSFAVDDVQKAREFYGPDIAWFKDPAGNVLAVLKND